MSIELVNSKVSALVGPALNWAVVKSLGLDVHHDAILGGVMMDGWHVSGLRGDPNRWVSLERCDYASDWALSGPLVEREKINITSHGDDWIAGYPKPVEFEGFRKYVFSGGDTPLNAAMRCFVESRLGNEIQVPADLIEQERNIAPRIGSRGPGL